MTVTVNFTRGSVAGDSSQEAARLRPRREIVGAGLQARHQAGSKDPALHQAVEIARRLPPVQRDELNRFEIHQRAVV
jgi:hypothetical protein